MDIATRVAQAGQQIMAHGTDVCTFSIDVSLPRGGR